MDRLKTFLKYILWIAGFWIASNVLIAVGINTTYKTIDTNQNLPSQINVTQAEATKVNGRIKTIITNSPQNDISGKYLKLNLYTKDNNLIGTRYVDIGEIAQSTSAPLDIYFKVRDVQYYNLSIVNEKEPDENFSIKLFNHDFSWGELVFASIFIYDTFL